MDVPLRLSDGQPCLAYDKGALKDSQALGQEFRTQLIEIVDAYDSMDHRIEPMGGTAIQNDCQALREHIRSMTEL